MARGANAQCRTSAAACVRLRARRSCAHVAANVVRTCVRKPARKPRLFDYAECGGGADVRQETPGLRDERDSEVGRPEAVACAQRHHAICAGRGKVKYILMAEIERMRTEYMPKQTYQRS